MYKLLLCWRYLRTRYIALASIISVMLGVATMIVVNSVMAGFTTEMQQRIHGILSDLSFESRSFDGMRDAEWHMQQIARVAGDSIEGMTPTVVVPAMLSYRREGGDEYVTQQVQLIGIDEKTHSQVSDFGEYLQHPENRRRMCFELREGGYDTRDHQTADAPERKQMKDAGWRHRFRVAQAEAFRRPFRRETAPSPPPEIVPESRAPADGPPDAAPEISPPHQLDLQSGLHPVKPATSPTEITLRQPRAIETQSYEAEVAEAPAAPMPGEQARNSTKSAASDAAAPSDPFAARRAENQSDASRFDPAKETHTGIVLGIALANFRTPDGEEFFELLPGNDVQLTFPTAGTPPKGISDDFTIVDFYESKMSEYDSNFVFVPIWKLQQLRGMIDPGSGVARVSSIQIKLKPGVDGNEVRDKLRAAFAPELYRVFTWRDKQGALLAAVQMETAILNVLLFLIIAVAGFGILAIFLMIVVEKTRDIGILKSLGASGRGVMGIFLAYGLSLGLVGSGVGMALGLLFVNYINEIADLLGKLTGRPVFDPSIYYFYKIPTIVDPFTVGWIVAGAITIAVLASILPALRAALLHPVEALRYE